MVMLRAIQAMYVCTESVSRSAAIGATTGECQGSPCSCLLSIIYMDQTVRVIPRSVGTDGYLATLHTLTASYGWHGKSSCVWRSVFERVKRSVALLSEVWNGSEQKEN